MNAEIQHAERYPPQRENPTTQGELQHRKVTVWYLIPLTVGQEEAPANAHQDHHDGNAREGLMDPVRFQ